MELPDVMRRVGWICFILMWIPFITMFVGIIGLPSGSYDWSELPALTRYSLLAVGALFTGTFSLIFGASIVSWWINRSIRAKGKLAEAEILKIWDTGTTINNNPVVRMLLEVRPKYHHTFEAEAEQLISRLKVSEYQPGAIIQVNFDPDNLEVALVDRN